METFIHHLASVDPGAHIGEGTKIWRWTHIAESAKIGSKCTIGQDCYIAGHLEDYCKIQNGVSVFDGVVMENGVFVGPGVVFTNVLRPRAYKPGTIKTIHISVGATIGANATIVCGIFLGAFCFIGAGAVVTKDVPPYALVVGNPAQIIGYVCTCGERLPEGGIPGEYCNDCR